MYPIGPPIQRQPSSTCIGNLDNLGIVIQAGSTPKFNLVIPLGNFEISSFREGSNIPAFGLESRIGKA